VDPRVRTEVDQLFEEFDIIKKGFESIKKMNESEKALFDLKDARRWQEEMKL
jgi:hypothetical protein